MTIREWVDHYCRQRGMSARQAYAVADEVMADKGNDPLQDRWDDDVAGCSRPVLAALGVTIDLHAVAYIEAHCPGHPLKLMFDGTAARMAKNDQKQQ